MILDSIKRVLTPAAKRPENGGWKTAGPDDEFVARNAFSPTKSPNFKDGFWKAALRTDAHPDRLGKTIEPSALVVHATDTAPGLFGNIIRYWQREKGEGNAATWMIGRNQDDGVVQFASIYRNANHAGGPACGGFRDPGSFAIVHPNLVTVGVELDCAGRLRYEKGRYLTWDRKVEIPRSAVYVHTDGTAWHEVTGYQMTVLKALWADLYPVLKPWKAVAVPGGTVKQEKWAKNRWNSLVGHATLNPTNKTDPGPQVMAWVNS